MSVSAGDTAFILISGALVQLMTPGLAFFYGGLVRSKNVLSIMIQSFISMGVVTVIWFVIGFSLAFGTDHGYVIGSGEYFGLMGVGADPSPKYGPTIPFAAFFGYQEMFAIITPALITGAFADRVDFGSYLIFLVLWSFLVYIPFVHWLWGGGFLQQWGVVDFAGGIVVHTSAGMAAMASVLFVGKRHIDHPEQTMPHNLAFVALGTGLLWFGWFGFNAGSELAANGKAAYAFINTDIAGSTAMCTWFIIAWIHDRRPTIVGVLTGSLAGLATITPCAGYVRPWAAFVIGIIASFACYFSVMLKVHMGWDDALDVWGVHGVGGMLGSILVGIFAQKKVNGVSGLIEGDWVQFLFQIAAVAITGVYAFGMTWLILKFISLFKSVRVSAEQEEKGLDETIQGEKAYVFENH